VKFWRSAEGLSGLVALNLLSTIRMSPAVGWVRANRAASEDLLAEVNDLRKENSQLKAPVGELTAQPAMEDLAGLSDKVRLYGTY